MLTNLYSILEATSSLDSRSEAVVQAALDLAGKQQAHTTHKSAISSFVLVLILILIFF